jgi:hypothetical protein
MYVHICNHPASHCNPCVHCLTTWLVQVLYNAQIHFTAHSIKERRNTHSRLNWKTYTKYYQLKQRYLFVGLCIDSRITLQHILKKWMCECRLDSSAPVVEYCEQRKIFSFHEIRGLSWETIQLLGMLHVFRCKRIFLNMISCKILAILTSPLAYMVQFSTYASFAPCHVK